VPLTFNVFNPLSPPSFKPVMWNIFLSWSSLVWVLLARKHGYPFSFDSGPPFFCLVYFGCEALRDRTPPPLSPPLPPHPPSPPPPPPPPPPHPPPPPPPSPPPPPPPPPPSFFFCFFCFFFLSFFFVWFGVVFVFFFFGGGTGFSVPFHPPPPPFFPVLLGIRKMNLGGSWVPPFFN